VQNESVISWRIRVHFLTPESESTVTDRILLELEVGILKGNLPIEEEPAKECCISPAWFVGGEYFIDGTEKGLQPCKCYSYIYRLK